MDLTGQRAIVTGGGRGVGKLIAELIAGAGGSVALVGRTEHALRDTADELCRGGAIAIPVVADVTDRQSSLAALATIRRELGPIDILVNNAGVLAFGLVGAIEPDEWWSGLIVNLKAPMEWCQYVLPEMISRKCGRIINVTSAAAVVTITGGSAYCASKAGLSAFTRVLNAEVQGDGVLAFACSPHVRTDMTDYVQASPLVPASFRHPVPKKVRDAQRQRTVDLFRRVLSGELDAHAGEHLDSESPPAA